MELSPWTSLLYIILLFAPLLFLQRFLQREIQAIFLLLTRQPELSMALFSLLFLPGVLLHETSHYVMAIILRVRTGRFSIIPRRIDGGQIRLGYVETVPSDSLRDSLIGLAPLITGGIFIAYAGASRMGMNTILESMLQGQMSSVSSAVSTALSQPDFWLWFYLAFTISSTMLPSTADRRAWMPVIISIALILGLVILVGVGPLIVSRFGVALAKALNAVAMVFGVTVLIHLVLMPPLLAIRLLISRLVGLKVV